MECMACRYVLELGELVLVVYLMFLGCQLVLTANSRLLATAQKGEDLVFLCFQVNLFGRGTVMFLGDTRHSVSS